MYNISTGSEEIMVQEKQKIKNQGEVNSNNSKLLVSIEFE